MYSFAWLTTGAFLLGSCPFALWLGRLCLNKDIRQYGDGNPGAANVFRAGHPAAGMLAVVLDVGKGVPFVFLAARVYQLPESQLVLIGLAAILGHAFSPLLRFRGGKAVAVTFGVLIGLMRPELLIPFALACLAGFLLLDSHAWTVVLAPLATCLYLLTRHTTPWPLLLMLLVLGLFSYKNRHEINLRPNLRPWLRSWWQSRRQA